jgi:hypothetical protein
MPSPRSILPPGKSQNLRLRIVDDSSNGPELSSNTLPLLAISAFTPTKTSQRLWAKNLSRWLPFGNTLSIHAVFMIMH